MNEQKTFLRYWHTITTEAAGASSQLLGILGRVLSLIIGMAGTTVVSLIVARGDIMTAVQTATITAAIWISLWVLVFIGELTYQPVVAHRKQQGVIDQLAADKSMLTEQALPKLELKYLDNDPASAQIDRTGENTGTQLRVCLRNISSTNSVENISISLVEVKSDLFTFLPAQLGVMNDVNNEAKRLNAGDCLFVDVIFVYATKTEAGMQYSFGFNFVVKNLKDRQTLILRELQDSEFTIQVTGDPICRPVREDFVFSVSRTENGATYQLQTKR